MPEGDTIWNTATRLRPALEGKILRRFEAERLSKPTPGAGDQILEVTARGKYLLIEFGNGQILETHMKMTGSWHLYKTGERWRKSSSSARVVLETTEDWVAVCFLAPLVQLRFRDRDQDSAAAHLGPDLCAPAPGIAEAVARLDRFLPPTTQIGIALLDQRVSAGIGNVYKSEVLHAAGVHPETPLAALAPDVRNELFETAHTFLRANLGSGNRTTNPRVPGGLSVYGRSGKPCFTCSTLITRTVQGEHVRSTYFCKGCQHHHP